MEHPFLALPTHINKPEYIFQFPSAWSEHIDSGTQVDSINLSTSRNVFSFWRGIWPWTWCLGLWCHHLSPVVVDTGYTCTQLYTCSHHLTGSGSAIETCWDYQMSGGKDWHGLTFYLRSSPLLSSAELCHSSIASSISCLWAQMHEITTNDSNPGLVTNSVCMFFGKEAWFTMFDVCCCLMSKIVLPRWIWYICKFWLMGLVIRKTCWICPKQWCLGCSMEKAISQWTKVSTDRGERSEFLGSSMEDCFLRGSGRDGLVALRSWGVGIWKFQKSVKHKVVSACFEFLQLVETDRETDKTVGWPARHIMVQPHDFELQAGCFLCHGHEIGHQFVTDLSGSWLMRQ